MIRNPRSAKRRTLLAGAAAAALGTAAACGDDGPAGTAEDPVTIGFEWWGNDVRAEITQAAVDLFEQKHEGIKVRTNFADYATYWEGLTGRMAAANLPDVFQMDRPRLQQFAGNGLLTPLRDLVDTSDYTESLLVTGEVGGELVAVPVAGNTHGLLYRADLLAEHDIPVPEAGYSWEDYGDLVRQLSGALGEGRWGGEDWTLSYLFLEMWLLQQGDLFYASDGSGLAFTPEQLTEWWAMTMPLKAEGAVPTVADTASMDTGGLAEDAVATMIRWDSILTGLAPTVEELGGTLALTAPPTLDPNNLGIYLKPSMQWVVAANSEHPEASAKLIDFLMTDPEAIAILGTNRGIPATGVGRDNVEIDEHTQQILDYEESVAEHLIEPPVPPPAAAGAVEAKYTEIFEQVAYEEMTPEAAAELFFTEAANLFASEQ